MNEKSRSTDTKSDRIETLIRNKRFSQLAQYKAELSSKGLREVLKSAYRRFIAEKTGLHLKIYNTLKLMDISGVTPESEDQLALLSLIIKRNSTAMFEMVVKKTGISKPKLKPLAPQIEQFYKQLIQGGKFQECKQIRFLSGIDIPDAIIQKGYKKNLMEGRIVSFIGLYKTLQIEPNRKMLEKMINRYRLLAKMEAEENNSISTPGSIKGGWVYKLEKIKEVMGIE